MRQTDSTKEAIGMSPQELSRAAENRTCGHHSFIGSPRVGVNSTAYNIHT